MASTLPTTKPLMLSGVAGTVAFEGVPINSRASTSKEGANGVFRNTRDSWLSRANASMSRRTSSRAMASELPIRAPHCTGTVVARNTAARAFLVDMVLSTVEAGSLVDEPQDPSMEVDETSTRPRAISDDEAEEEEEEAIKGVFDSTAAEDCASAETDGIDVDVDVDADADVGRAVVDVEMVGPGEGLACSLGVTGAGADAGAGVGLGMG